MEGGSEEEKESYVGQRILCENSAGPNKGLPKIHERPIHMQIFASSPIFKYVAVNPLELRARYI